MGNNRGLVVQLFKSPVESKRAELLCAGHMREPGLNHSRAISLLSTKLQVNTLLQGLIECMDKPTYMRV